MWTWFFWKDAIERAIRAGAVAFGGALGADGSGMASLGWAGIFTIAGYAALGSLCLSIGAGSATGSSNASFFEIKGDVAPDKK